MKQAPPPLDELKASRVDIVPDNYWTGAELSKHWKKGRKATSGDLRELIKIDRCRMKKFKLKTGKGIQPIPHYTFPPF